MGDEIYENEMNEDGHLITDGMYVDRYLIKTWGMNMPSICAMETDLYVFRNKNQSVPVQNPTNDKCLKEYKNWCPVYRAVLYDIFKVSANTTEPAGSFRRDGSEVFPSASEFAVPPKSIAELPIRLQRFDFRYPEHTGAVIFATGCNRDQSAYNHDGLVVLPNYNFIGEFSSEIGPTVRVYNSTDTPLTYKTHYNKKSDSPVGVLFEHLPFDKKFDAVTVQGFPPKLIIPANDSVSVQLAHARHSSSRSLTKVKASRIFYTSVGACEIPDGVFMDDIADENGRLNIFNITDKNLQIIFREDNTEDTIRGDNTENTNEDEESFLGYVITLPLNIKLHVTKDSSNVLKVNLDSARPHSAYLFKTSDDFVVPSKSSMIVKLNGVQITNSLTETLGLLKGEIIDRSYWVMKFIKLLSLVPGIKIITPVLEYNLYSRGTGRDNIEMRVFNVTANDITLQKGEHTVGGLVCQASKLTGKDSAGNSLR